MATEAEANFKYGEDVGRISCQIILKTLKTVPFLEGESRVDHYSLIKALEASLGGAFDDEAIAAMQETYETRDLKKVEEILKVKYKYLVDMEYELATSINPPK